MNKIVYLNPNTQIIPIKDKLFLALNPNIRNGLKLINEHQLKVLRNIDNETDVAEIAKKTGHTEEVIIKLIDIFNEIEISGYSQNFNAPPLPDKVENIDFWVHTTDACNFNCPYCYIDKTTGKNMSNETLNKFIKKIIEVVKQRKLSEVSLRFSGGEPFIRFHEIKKAILNLKEGLKVLDCKTNFGFLTNLTLLNKEIMDFIKQENLFTSISMDGYGEYHNNSRFFNNGKGSFDIIDKNINTLLENGHKRIIIMTVISDRNIDGLTEFAHYLAKKNIPFRFSIVTGEEINIEKLKQKLFEVYDIFELYIKSSTYAFARNHHLDDLRLLRPSHLPCSAGQNSGSLNTDGKIYFCQQELGNSNNSGSIFDQNDLIENIQSKQAWHTPLHQDCDNCQYRYVCSGGCPLFRINGKSPHCSLYKELLPRIYQLIGLERYYRLKKSPKPEMHK